MVAIKMEIDFIKMLPTITLYFIVLLRLMPVFSGINTDIQTIKYSKFQINDVIRNIKNFKLNNKIKINNLEKNIKYKINEIYFRQNKFNTLQIKNLNFSYSKNSDLIFKNANLEVNDGQIIVIEGENGSGKSTLVDLISGLLEPDSGEILFNGTNILKNISLWQNNIGYVSQHSFLSNNTIKENIIFGRKNISKKKLEIAIKIANLNKIINKLPNGINTMIGSFGKFLSGGQKQRIIIARALLENPKVIILDEPTVALDIRAELSFLNIIKKLKKDKLIFLISHSINAKKFCDLSFEITKRSFVKKKI